MEILYRIFIGMISSKIARKIDGIGLQCRRDNKQPPKQLTGDLWPAAVAAAAAGALVAVFAKLHGPQGVDGVHERHLQVDRQEREAEGHGRQPQGSTAQH